MEIKDITGKVIKVGDIVASQSWDFGTAMKVVAVNGWRLDLVKAFRGRKVFTLDGSGWRVVSR